MTENTLFGFLVMPAYILAHILVIKYHKLVVGFFVYAEFLWPPSFIFLL